MTNDARLRPLASRRSWFAPREIAIRDPWGVRWLRLSRRMQVSAAALGLAAFAWVGHATIATLAPPDRTGEQAEAITRLRAELDGHERAADSLRQEVARLRSEKAVAEAARSAAERQSATEVAAAAATAAQDRVTDLEYALADAYLTQWRLAESLAVADDRIASLEGKAVGLRDLAAIAGQQATQLKDKVATLELLQGQLVERLKPATDVEVALLERNLAPTRLDLDSVVAAVADEGSGGPLLPVMDDLAPTIENARLNDLTNSTARLDALKAAAISMPLALPVRLDGIEVRSNFGNRRDPINRRAAFHAGIDFGGAVGTPVFATAPGEVVSAGWAGAYGRAVRIRHAFGLETQYAHLSRVSVKVGDKVDAGDVIGKLGSTGRSTGPHLHYEVRLLDAPNDPMRFIEAGRNVQQQTEQARDEAGK
ncbi:M23 family metallopeptidase [Zavarzinia sp.]|uniref:M23 family metallopeptidase n=1 Tax=Zavarzinia sp. TaxID=2027920 RepID=UPI003BB6470D